MNAGLIGSIINNYYYKDEDDKMTDHKFTDDEIIKALECCVNNDSCKECPINPNHGNYGYCTNLALTHALALINRQKVEIEATEKECADLLGQRNAVEMMLDRANYNCEKADEKIEYLKSENARLITSNSQLEARVCEDRAEIEMLNAVHADMTESLRLAAEANKDMQAELEDLREIVFMDRSEAIKNLKAETIKEFAQRLKKRARMPLGTLYGGMVYLKDIDNLVKIMTEGNNESQNT